MRRIGESQEQSTKEFQAFSAACENDAGVLRFILEVIDFFLEFPRKALPANPSAGTIDVISGNDFKFGTAF